MFNIPADIPPANVEVAVVVDMIDPTVSIEEVEVIDVPSNHSRERAGIDDELVPPFMIPRVPVTSVVFRSTAVPKLE